MSRKSSFEPAALCAGMQTGIEFLSQLQKAIERQGGSSLLLWFATLPKNVTKLNKLAQFIVEQHFAVPRSIIEALVAQDAYEELVKDPDLSDCEREELITSDRSYGWSRIDLQRSFGIPEVGFSCPLIPVEIKQQIVGCPLREPHIIQYGGEPQVVTSFYYEGELAKGNRPTPGFVYDDALTTVCLSPAKYFDLEN